MRAPTSKLRKYGSIQLFDVIEERKTPFWPFLERDHAEGVDVHLVAVLLVAEYLGRHVSASRIKENKSEGRIRKMMKES